MMSVKKDDPIKIKHIKKKKPPPTDYERLKNKVMKRYYKEESRWNDSVAVLNDRKSEKYTKQMNHLESRLIKIKLEEEAEELLRTPRVRKKKRRRKKQSV